MTYLVLAVYKIIPIIILWKQIQECKCCVGLLVDCYLICTSTVLCKIT
jgi:hypothetical protein